DYVDQAHQLLEDVDLKQRPASQVEKRKAFEDWFLAEVAAGREPVVPAAYRSILGQRHYTKLAINELLELDRAVGQIVQLDGVKNKVGPWRRMIFDRMVEAQNHEKDLLHNYTSRLNALIKAVPKSQLRQWDRRVDTPELVIRNVNHSHAGEAFAGTKDQVV